MDVECEGLAVAVGTRVGERSMEEASVELLRKDGAREGGGAETNVNTKSSQHNNIYILTLAAAKRPFQ